MSQVVLKDIHIFVNDFVLLNIIMFRILNRKILGLQIPYLDL